MSVIENLNGQNRPRTALVWSTKCKLQLSVARIPPWCSLLGMNAVEDGLSVRLGHLAFSHATAGGGAGEDGQDAESVLRSDEENVEGHTNGNTSPPAQTEATKKKKKKNKAKKAAQATEAEIEAGRIKISRNKHMRFISSYHVCQMLLMETVSLPDSSPCNGLISPVCLVYRVHGFSCRTKYWTRYSN